MHAGKYPQSCRFAGGAALAWDTAWAGLGPAQKATGQGEDIKPYGSFGLNFRKARNLRS